MFIYIKKKKKKKENNSPSNDKKKVFISGVKTRPAYMAAHNQTNKLMIALKFGHDQKGNKSVSRNPSPLIVISVFFQT